MNGFPDTLKILAIMVQFQPDSDTLTSGNGQFDLTTAPQRIIDAPPRDSSYFADHLLFAKNYFPKASNGKAEYFDNPSRYGTDAVETNESVCSA